MAGQLNIIDGVVKHHNASVGVWGLSLFVKSQIGKACKLVDGKDGDGQLVLCGLMCKPNDGVVVHHADNP
jgi:hypothetical protein